MKQFVKGGIAVDIKVWHIFVVLLLLFVIITIGTPKKAKTIKQCTTLPCSLKVVDTLIDTLGEN